MADDIVSVTKLFIIFVILRLLGHFVTVRLKHNPKTRVLIYKWQLANPKMKQKLNSETESTPSKKIKLNEEQKSINNVDKNKKVGKAFPKVTKTGKPLRNVKTFRESSKNGQAGPKHNKLYSKGSGGRQDSNNFEKVEDWLEFKKKKKELKLKRKQGKQGFDIITRAKKIGEELRKKNLKGGEEKRIQLINELHNLLKNKGHYPKFVLAHDTARLVQWLIKYASSIVIQQISKELIPQIVNMLQSKYGRFCVKRLMKYGDSKVRSTVIDAMQGNAVKLTSHLISAPIFEYAFSTWASPKQKQFFIQEFFGDLYKNSKDTNIKHIRDTYKDNESLKAATLGATKANLLRIINKSLLDSALVQSVLRQYLSECSEEDRKEFIVQLASHIVIISNSRDGARTAMQCIWHGSNKDRKVMMKTMKEHIVDLSKHEHGHCTVICLLDSADDTVLLHKVILTDILKNAEDLAVSEWGRKVLLWLVAPGDTTIFHPVFVKELTEGREASTCKKSLDIRRKEILQYSVSTLLRLVATRATFWLSNASLAVEMLAIVKTGKGEELEEAYNIIVEVITDLEWKVKENGKEILGVEHAGLHMVLKKLAQSDKTVAENSDVTFGSCLVKKLNDELLSNWINLNRGCFLLVAIFENGTLATQTDLKANLKKHKKLLKQQESPGAKILLKKIT